MTLLIVDDSNIIRRTIARYIDRGQFSNVFTAGNGREAIGIFRDQCPDFVTLDITMPEVDGLDCLEEMMQINDAARILVISALADKATAIEALKRGAQAFLCKPFTADELNGAVTELLSEA